MANTILTPSIIAKEGLRLLENNLVLSKGVNRQYAKEFGDAKIGDTVNARVPSKYTVRSGAVASVQDHTETSVPVVVDTQKGIDLAFTSKEKALSIENFAERVMAPAMATLASDVDLQGHTSMYSSVANAVGTPGTIPNTMKTYAQAGAKLDYEAAPKDANRRVILGPLMEVELIDAQKGLFHSGSEIEKQYKNGEMGKAAGFTFAMSQNLATHTVGAYVGTPLTNGATSSGATQVITDGWTGSVSGLLKKGDVVTFAGVFAVNPYTKQSTNQLRQFVVTADVASSSGAATIPIFPAIIATGAQQNVTNVPADNSAIVVLGAASAVTPTGLAFHKDAFTLVTVDLPLPDGVNKAARASSEASGLSVRYVEGYDIVNDRFISRFDILFGWKCVRPELACRIQS